MASGPASLACEHCGETFLRREHRDRHLRRHSGVKPFQCNVCHKSFARSDTLVRHSSLHRHEGQTHGTPRRCVRACLSCARLKQRCRGGQPCARCRATGTECTYSPAKAAGAQGLPSPRTSDTPATPIGAVTPRSLRSDQYPDRNDELESIGSFVTAGKTTRPAEQFALHPHTATLASNRHDVSSISPPDTAHSIYAPAVFTTSLLDSDPTLDVPGQWDPSLFLYGNAAADEFAAEWDVTAALFPFCPVPEGSGELLGTQHDIENHNQQRGVGAHSPTQAFHVQSQATPNSPVRWPRQAVSDEPPDPDLAFQNMNGSRLHGGSPSRRFPQTQPIHMQMAEAETFGHVRNIPYRAYDEARKFYASQYRDSTAGFIPMRLVQAFVDLYFEYFDHQFPFLHVSRLEAEELPWILLLATAAIGSYYSELDGIRDYTSILCDLLGRAVDHEAMVHVTRPSKTLIQCVFLRHVHLSFCGLHREKILSQHKRSMLVAMCRDLMARKQPARTTESSALAPHSEWATWLATEEDIRLVCCVYSQFARLALHGYGGTNDTSVLECISFLFMDVPPEFNFSDFTQQMPCPSRLWYSKDIQDWSSKKDESQAGRMQPGASQEAPTTKTEYDPFLSKLSLLMLFTNEKNIQRQRSSSRFLMSSFGAHLKAMGVGASRSPVEPPTMETDGAGIGNPLLDESVDRIAFKTWEPVPGRGHHVETLIHILAILRCVSLRTLFAGTGWRADTAQMKRLKMKFKDFVEHDAARARKSMWHAACVFKSVQSTQRFACHDMYSLGVATCYIILYIESWQKVPPPSQAPADAGPKSPSSARRRIVRLDQLSGREDVQDWIQNGGDADIHLAGVGILSGPDTLPRLLRATEKALVGQIAWSVFSRAWARTMVQLRRGEKPTVQTDDYNEEQERAPGK